MKFVVLFVVLIAIVNGLEQEEVVTPHNNERAISTWADSTIFPLYSTAQTGGLGTYYGAYTSGGACTLDPTPGLVTSSFFATVAIADNIWASSQACGLCLEVTPTGSGSGGNPLPTGPFLVFVNNECPSCANNGLDFGLSGDGAWGITWQAVDCPVTGQSISYLFQGSNSYYIKIQIRNSRVPVYNVYVQTSSGLSNALVRTADNFFTAPSGGPSIFPLATKITLVLQSIAGDEVTDQVTWIAGGAAVGTGVQFPASSGLSTATATTGTTAKATTTTSTATTAKATTTTTTGTTAKATTTTTTTATTATTAKGTTTATTATTAKSTTTTTTTGKSTTATTGSATTAKSTTTTTTGSVGVAATLSFVVNTGTNVNWFGVNSPIGGADGPVQNLQISVSGAWVNMTVVSYGWTYSTSVNLVAPLTLRVVNNAHLAAVATGAITSLTPATYTAAVTYLPY